MRIHLRLVAVLAVAVAGCGKKGPSLAEVEGTLTLRGKPFPGALLCFVPDARRDSIGPRASALTDENGHYTIVCDDPHKPGALVGKHVVVVQAEQFWAGGELPYDRKYTSPVRTPLHAEVAPGGRQVFDFDVE